MALFVSVPRIDLWVSRQVYDAARGGFWLADHPAMRFARDVFWYASVFMMLAALSGLIWPYLGVPRRIWSFIIALYVLGPGVLVNLLLKEHWGRARPAHIAEFGGAAQFTPAGAISDQCATNCSFVSGEVASAAAFTLSALVLIWRFRAQLSARARIVAVALASAITIGAAVQRVAAGRHFLSDAVFAVLFVAAVALALLRVLAPRR